MILKVTAPTEGRASLHIEFGKDLSTQRMRSIASLLMYEAEKREAIESGKIKGCLADPTAEMAFYHMKEQERVK